VGGDVSINNNTFLMTDFMNLKIKPTQSFGDTHKVKIYIHMFIGMSVHTYISIYIYTMFLKKYFILFILDTLHGFPSRTRGLPSNN
jgi:hypothetical protein